MRSEHIAMLEFAAEHHSVVTRSEARAAGLSDAAIDRCTANGLLVRVAPHVFRVRGAPPGEVMAMRAAAAGALGLLSHSTSLRCFRTGVRAAASPLHVMVEGPGRRPRVRRIEVSDDRHAFYAVEVHRSQCLGGPIVHVDGIPSVDVARALVDAAATLGAEELEAAFERARTLGLVSTAVLARRFASIGGRGRPGTTAIRRLLEHAAPNPLDSRLEVKAWRLLCASSVGRPVPQLWVRLPAGHRHRLDFAWPALRVALETEGFEWHGSRARWKQDKVRTARLERAGWRLVVATWDDVVRSPGPTLDRLRLALDERRTFLRAS